MPLPWRLSCLLLEVELLVVLGLSVLPLWPFPWALLLLLLLELLEVVGRLAVVEHHQGCYCWQQGPNPRDLPHCQRPVINFAN